MPRSKKLPPPQSVDPMINPEPGRIEAIWREVKMPLIWTTAAFTALAVVVFVGTTNRGEERLAVLPQAVGELVGNATALVPPQVVAMVGQQIDPLREAAKRTSEERKQIEWRITELERSLNDVTGSIRRQPPADVTGSIDRPGQPAQTTGPAPQPVIVYPNQVPVDPPPGTAAPPQAASPPRPLPRPTDPQAPQTATGTLTLATRTQFGIDLGSEPTLAALKARWQRLAEKHAALMGTLEPVISVREAPNGQPVLYLVAGPLGDVSDAATLCVKLRAQGASACQPASYDGQRLTLR